MAPAGSVSAGLLLPPSRLTKQVSLQVSRVDAEQVHATGRRVQVRSSGHDCRGAERPRRRLLRLHQGERCCRRADQRLTTRADDQQGRCNREKPPCKYFHPPQHLKDQLLINGRNHLALKNALMQSQMPHLPILGAGQMSVVSIRVARLTALFVTLLVSLCRTVYRLENANRRRVWRRQLSFSLLSFSPPFLLSVRPPSAN